MCKCAFNRIFFQTAMCLFFITTSCAVQLLAEDGESKELLSIWRLLTNGVSVPIGDGRAEVIPLKGVAFPLSQQPHGRESLEAAEKLIPKTKLECLVTTVSGKRWLQVPVGKGWLNADVISAGLAWHDPRDFPSPELAALQAEAKAARRGLWAGENPIAPWEYPAYEQKLLREKWAKLQTLVSAENRATALAVLDKAEAAQGGKAQLKRLYRSHIQCEIQLSSEIIEGSRQSSNPFGIVPILIEPFADQQKLFLDICLDLPDRFRITMHGEPALKGLWSLDGQVEAIVQFDWDQGKTRILNGARILNDPEVVFYDSHSADRGGGGYRTQQLNGDGILEHPASSDVDKSTSSKEESEKVWLQTREAMVQYLEAGLFGFAKAENFLIQLTDAPVGSATQTIRVISLPGLNPGQPPLDKDSLNTHPSAYEMVFDSSTGLLQSWSIPEWDRPPRVLQFSEYQDFDGLKFASQIQKQPSVADKAPDKGINKFKITKLEFPAVMDDKYFPKVLLDPKAANKWGLRVQKLLKLEK